MKTKSKTKIYFNIFISLLFIALGIFLISVSGNERKMIGIPLRMLVGSLGVLVNTILALKWIFKLKAA